jgi:hypothetical protein
MTYKPPTDAESVDQLIGFHGMQPNPPDVGTVSNDRLQHLAMRSMLIDKDLTASDGHEEVLHDRTDTLTLRQLIHEVWVSRHPPLRSWSTDNRDPAAALVQYNAVNSRHGDEE